MTGRCFGGWAPWLLDLLLRALVVNSLRRGYHVVANSLLVGIIRLSPRREDVNGSPRNVSFAVNLRRCLSVPP